MWIKSYVLESNLCFDVSDDFHISDATDQIANTGELAQSYGRVQLQMNRALSMEDVQARFKYELE